MNSQLYQFVDLTSLKEDDSIHSIKLLCEKAIQHQVAAVCVFPQFIKDVKKNLTGSNIKIATVANFPSGLEDEEQVLTVMEKSLQEGADEIDVVFPYQQYFAGNQSSSLTFIRRCKSACGLKKLKVIVESGAISGEDVLFTLCQKIIDCGADFLKTSTGKIKVGATLASAKTMLQAIKSKNATVGFKASGGIRTFGEVAQYKALAEEIMTAAWVTESHFRIGTSGLL